MYSIWQVLQQAAKEKMASQLAGSVVETASKDIPGCQTLNDTSSSEALTEGNYIISYVHSIKLAAN